MADSTVRFGLLCSMFQAMLRDRSAAKKRKRFRTFLERVYTGRDYFSAIRLLLPGLDRERGTYGLKEAALAALLVDALGISKDSDDARRLINWRRGGSRSGANAGNFALVAAEVLQRRQGIASGGLTIKQLNDELDQLASRESRGEKSAVLSGLIKRTNAMEMKWILMIILKDLKLGISEKSIFHEFHPDAEDLFNVTCDLKLVCEKLSDRSQRHKRQDIDVGKAVRPQLALRISDTAAAWKKLQGKNVVAECKFDGDRIQIHKNGSEIHFFSRNFLDHLEYAPAMSTVIIGNVLVDRCILDGEMLVWDKSSNRFLEFGSNQEIAKAAREGLEDDRQLCYVAFDILHGGDTSVIHQSLAERQILLQKVVKPLKGRLEILIPNDGINDNRAPGEPCWSILANTLDDVAKFFKETVENRDEGIVLKDLGSKWEPGDRSGKWLKLKPDYVNAGADLDVLIIGGYYGSGRHGGQVAQFLLGLAAHADPETYPRRFVSFCRVGTGLGDEELDMLVSKLNPYFRKNENSRSVPQFYDVTNHSKERPDVWVDSPDKSVILSITSDIRTIKSEVFSAPYCLRFPRIQHVRYDKPWYECLDVHSFVELVHSSNGSMPRSDNQGYLQNTIRKRTQSKKKEDHKNLSIVPCHLIQTDTSGVKAETLIFANMMFYFINASSSHTINDFHKLITENRGMFSMNLNDSVTHCIAAEKKGIKYQAAIRHRDVIHYSWVLNCIEQKRLVPLNPKYFLFLAESSKAKFQEVIDQFSDNYYVDLDITDIMQILSNMTQSESSSIVEYYMNKYQPLNSLCLFVNSCIYFVEAIDLDNRDEDLGVLSDLALRRLKLDVMMRGGKVCSALFEATHLVAYSTSESLDFHQIYNRVPSSQRGHFHDGRLHVVTHLWLEESLEAGRRLPEDSYRLKPDNWEEFKNVASKLNFEAPVMESSTALAAGNIEEIVHSKDESKKGSSSGKSTKRVRAYQRPARRTRARIGSRRAQILPDGSGGDSSGRDGGRNKPQETGEGPSMAVKEEVIKNDKSETSKRGRRVCRRPTRRSQARIIRTRQSKIDPDEPEGDFSGGDGGQRRPLETREGTFSGTKEEETTKVYDIQGISDTSRAVKDEHFEMEPIAEGRKIKQRFEGEQLVEMGKDEHFGIKPEQMPDPLHSVLLDMIPSLRHENLEKKGGGFVPNIKSEEGCSTQSEIQTVDSSKKKKVSYKDVASQLLKD